MIISFPIMNKQPFLPPWMLEGGLASPSMSAFPIVLKAERQQRCYSRVRGEAACGALCSEGPNPSITILMSY